MNEFISNQIKEDPSFAEIEIKEEDFLKALEKASPSVSEYELLIYEEL